MSWFKSQSNLVKFILLILPIVGWIVELVIRWSVVVEKPSALNIVMALVYTFVGWAWVLCVIDAVLCLLGGSPLLLD